MFLMSTSAPQACWTMVGIGIRLAQDVGAHRRKIRKVPSPASTASEAKERIEEELWSRAWWVLVCLDRMLSSAMGRPCAIQDEDFDLEMPVVVDDEYASLSLLFYLRGLSSVYSGTGKTPQAHTPPLKCSNNQKENQASWLISSCS